MWRSVWCLATCDCVGVDVATCSALRWLVTNGACQPTCSAPTPPQLRLPPLPCQTRQDLIGYYATWRRPSLSCSVTDVIKTICNSTIEARFLVPPAHSSQSPPPPPHTPRQLASSPTPSSLCLQSIGKSGPEIRAVMAAPSCRCRVPEHYHLNVWKYWQARERNGRRVVGGRGRGCHVADGAWEICVKLHVIN